MKEKSKEKRMKPKIEKEKAIRLNCSQAVWSPVSEILPLGDPRPQGARRMFLSWQGSLKSHLVAAAAVGAEQRWILGWW